MKKLLLCIAVISCMYIKAQTTFWTENFGASSGCDNGSLATAYTSTNGAWTTSNTGTNDTYANSWYISAAEAGMGVNNCGDGCGNTSGLTNRTLHVGIDFSLLSLYDQGAIYLAGSGANTNKRIMSPTINCNGKSGISLHFNYIMWGILNADYAQVQYSPDNGANWINLGIPAQTPTTSCSGQGLWTSYSVALPATADNNATVKIGFRWQNTDATGADPSFAVDDIEVIAATSVSITLTPSFSISPNACEGFSTTVTANTGTTAATGYTWTSNPTGPAIASPNASATVINFANAGTYTITLTAAAGTLVASTTETIQIYPNPTVSVNSSTNTVCVGSAATLSASGASTYTWMPGSTNGSTVLVTPSVNTTYTVVGTGSFGCQGSNTITIAVITCSTTTGIYTFDSETSLRIFPNPANNLLNISVIGGSGNTMEVVISDLSGKILYTKPHTIKASENIILSVENFSPGIYLLQLNNNSGTKRVYKIVKE